jgi:hypothetical protein
MVSSYDWCRFLLSSNHDPHRLAGDPQDGQARGFALLQTARGLLVGSRRRLDNAHLCLAAWIGCSSALVDCSPAKGVMMTEEEHVKAQIRISALMNLIDRAEDLLGDALNHHEVGYASLVELRLALNEAREAFQIPFPFPQDKNAVWHMADGRKWRPNNAKLS